MKRLLLLFCAYCLVAGLSAQIITTDPVFPVEDQPVTITFNAAEGNGGLAGYTEDIWAHTGVITDKSTGPSNWKYVVAGWGENKEKAKLTHLEGDLWTLEIGPSIREYYGVLGSDTVKQLAFVFRNADGSRYGKTSGGGDIFARVYQAGLNLTITQPAKDFVLVDSQEILTIEAAATMADSILVFEDGIQIHSAAGTNLEFAYTTAETGIHSIEVRAYAAGNEVSDSFAYMVRGGSHVAELPAGLRLGANYTSDTSATLVLHAPEKEFVFVIGDFTDWMVEVDFIMKQTPDEQYFWLEISDLEAGKEYGYQFLIEGELHIADPYTHKTLDPWGDQYIPVETYPNLLAYPTGKTTSIASILQTNQPVYEWQVDTFDPPAKNTLVVYELLIRDFLQNHSFLGLIDTLDYLSNLGVNVIELMPVNEFEWNESWGYNTSFHFAVDKYYGPADTYKAFIDSAHQRGMAVVMDMVLNHAFGQNPLTQMYWNGQANRPAENNPWFNETSPNPIFSWGYDFNHESLATQAYVDSVCAYWLQEFRVDGFRFDFTKGFTNTPGDGGAYDSSRIAILKRMADQIWTVNANAYVILEHFAENTEEIELANYGMMIWGNMNHSYRIASKGYLGVGASDLSWASYNQRGWDQPHLVGFMESHDEERLMHVCLEEGNFQNPEHSVKDLDIALQRMELCAHFHIPVPGPKMIWMFGELGYDYSIDYNGRVGNKPIRWDYYNIPLRKRLYQVYGELNRLKTSNSAFGSSDFELSLRDSVKRISLNDDDMNVHIIGNFATWNHWGQTDFQHEGWWFEFWSGDSLFVENTQFWINFGPSEYRLYTDVKLEQPDILSVIERHQAGDNFDILLYPNPAGDQVSLELPFTSEEKVIRVFDINGRTVYESQGLPGSQTQEKIDLSQLGEGIYVLHVICQSFNWQGKLILAGK